MYAGMSARIASSLMLHIPSTATDPHSAEHRKRVWWSTYLMDTMVSSEMGLRAAFVFAQAEHALPSDDRLPAVQRADFWDAGLMTALVRLCSVRSLILESVGRLHETDFEGYQRLIDAPIRELEAWRRGIPSEISFEFAEGVPEAMHSVLSTRSIASVYLRYHQVGTWSTLINTSA